MKKYACHRLYICPDRFLKQAVIALDENGKVLYYANLQEETEATEWIGGIIILADTLTKPDGTFHTWLENQMKNSTEQRYAWHISDFDFVNERPTAQSIFRKLN